MPVLDHVHPLRSHVGEDGDHRRRDVGCLSSVVELRVLLLLLLLLLLGIGVLLLLLLLLLLVLVGKL